MKSNRKTIRNEKDLNIRKKFLNGLVDRIIVNYVDKNTHTLRVFFKIPYINDRLIWKNEKNKKLGYELVQKLIDICKENYKGKKIKISAQKHLQKFYEKCGFVKCNEQMSIYF